MRRTLTTAIVALALAGCGGGSSAGGAGGGGAGGGSHLDSVRAGAKAACSYSATFLAREFGTSTDPSDIAEAYASGLDPSAHDAAFEGCLDGIH